MTSNIGAEILLNSLTPGGELMGSGQDQVMAELKLRLRPEFLNRLDDIVVFNPLTRENLRLIAKYQMKDLKATLAEQQIGISVSASALDTIIEDAWDPQYGARPLRRHIEKTFGTELSRRLIAQEIGAGQFVTISADGGNFTYEISSQIPEANDEAAEKVS